MIRALHVPTIPCISKTQWDTQHDRYTKSNYQQFVYAIKTISIKKTCRYSTPNSPILIKQWKNIWSYIEQRTRLLDKRRYYLITTHYVNDWIIVNLQIVSPRMYLQCGSELALFLIGFVLPKVFPIKLSDPVYFNSDPSQTVCSTLDRDVIIMNNQVIKKAVALFTSWRRLFTAFDIRYSTLGVHRHECMESIQFLMNKINKRGYYIFEQCVFPLPSPVSWFRTNQTNNIHLYVINIIILWVLQSNINSSSSITSATGIFRYFAHLSIVFEV